MQRSGGARDGYEPGSSGAVPVGWPEGLRVIFSMRASARLRSDSQWRFSASPRS